jgi:hypothetical protein
MLGVLKMASHTLIMDVNNMSCKTKKKPNPKPQR